MSDKTSTSADSKSEADVKLFKFLRKKKADDKDGKFSILPQKLEIQIPAVEPRDCDNYGMSNYKRGKALIFNHFSFDNVNLSKRDGTHEDCANITALLKKLHFDVIVHDDLEVRQINVVMEEVSQEDHSGNDCIVIVVMTHGNTTGLHAKDTIYSADKLWMSFTGDKCKSLAGKPKLVFIQTSISKKKKRKNINIEIDSIVSTVTFKIPTMADFLVMYSSSEEPSENGSLFIRTLCQEFNERYMKQDVISILTFVRRNMNMSQHEKITDNFDEAKPLVTLVSSLTRLMYFCESQ